MGDIRIRSTEARGAALVDDVAFDGPDGLEVEAYLVRPAEPDADVPAAGLVMWHWLDSEAPDGNRTQYLDEAADLTAAGVVCLLFQFGRSDFFIAAMSGLEFRAPAPAGSELLPYDCGHDMRLPEIVADRRAFLVRTLGLRETA